MTVATVRVPIERITGDGLPERRDDSLAVEEPLEIRVNGKSLSVTMRTPGNDFELPAGFLFSEGIVASAGQMARIARTPTEHPNIVAVELVGEPLIKPIAVQRAFVMTSACGLCGKASLAALEGNRCPVLPPISQRFSTGVILGLPEGLRRRQAIFDSTGGLHAAALFEADGTLASLREDVGRHNAVDKLIGNALLRGETPLSRSMLMVSGRASYELVQKALMAGIPLLAAVGAPSSLAVATATRCGMTLIGFLRNGRFNIYSGTERIQ